MNKHYIALEFPRIVAMLQDLAVSRPAREQLSALTPSAEEAVCLSRMDATTAARRVLDAAGSPPLAVMDALEDTLQQAVQGDMLSPQQLTSIAGFAISCRRMEAYLCSAADQSAGIAAYRMELPDLTDLCREIEYAIREDRLLDDASAALRSLRRSRENLETEIRDKLNRLLQTRKQYLADSYITTRAGRYVLPVQKKYQSTFGGTAVDVSAKGTTVFMEPASIAPLRMELESTLLLLDQEERRILYALSDRAAQEEAAIRRGMRIMTDLDVLFAKAKLSQQMDARPAQLTGKSCILLRSARHPLLDKDKAVPLDFYMEGDTTGVVITGPNTGGKTVCVKTVGLLCLMAQCGLHLPCQEAVIPLRDAFLCDIGDSQSIAQSLSTFSGHMTNVIHILACASQDSLVLLDELGSGTDPAEGMGIAVAVLEELRRRRCLFLVTTHYPQVKTWAENTPGVMAARMAFDHASLAPLPIPRSQLKRRSAKPAPVQPAFAMGDSVRILPDGVKGIVYRPADQQGNLVVQVQGEKLTIRHTRVQLLVPAAELYPPDYDFSIIFDTVENRKAAHQMGRKFDPSAVIIHQEGVKAE